MNGDKPVLIEPGVKYFLNETLKQCNSFRNTHYNTLFNISLFAGLLLILGIFLLVKYKGKLTPHEKWQNDQNKMKYVLARIRNFQEAKQHASQTLITGLPLYENEYDVIHRV